LLPLDLTFSLLHSTFYLAVSDPRIPGCATTCLHLIEGADGLSVDLQIPSILYIGVYGSRMGLVEEEYDD
jgi:hypothetical protein